VRFLADMGVSWRVAQHLRAHDHDVCHLSDEGLQRLPDGEIFQKATTEQGAIVVVEENRCRIRRLPIEPIEPID